MSESKIPPFSLEETRALPEDEVESARILLREGLIEESKKTLYRVLTQKTKFKPALDLLKQIEALELKDLFVDTPTGKPVNESLEDTEALISALDRDLGLQLEPDLDFMRTEIWAHSTESLNDLPAKARYDLGVAFFEMGCFVDALRELQRAEKKIRIEETFLGETGLAIVSLIAQCLVALERGFEAKSYLEPVLIEPDLNHEDKFSLYYVMGLAEESLGSPRNALGWYKKIDDTDKNFRDVQIKIRQLRGLIDK